MDPTAPDNNDPNSQNPQAPQSPIQPGQFVVASQDNLGGQPQAPNQLPPQPGPPLSVPPQANPFGAPQNAAPPPQPFAQGYTGNNFQDQTFQNPVGNPAQPDPAPFAPPVAAGQQEQPPGEDSKSKMIKIVGIVLGVLALLAIIAGLVWFFVINKGAEEDINTTVQDVIEEPAPIEQNPEAGFGELPEATAPAETPAEPPAEIPPQNPDSSTTNPPVQ